MAKYIKQLTLDKVQSESQSTCNFCGMDYPAHECQAFAAEEDVNIVKNFNRGD